MTRGKRLLGLTLVGAILVSGALWARQRWDPDRFRAVPLPQLEAWVADHPEDADALSALGRRYRAQGQVTDARQTLERARRLEPGNARLLNDLGELCAAQGDYLAAQQLFEQAIQVRPDLPAPQRNLGNLAGIAGNYVLALRHYNQALALQPNDPETLCALGSAYGDAENHGQAEAAFAKAITLAPRSPEPYQRLGLARYRFHDYAGARAALRQALERAPNDPNTHLFLGLAFAQQPGGVEDERQALEHLDRATALGSTSGEADFGRALVYFRRKQYPQAIAAFEAAIPREGGGDTAHYLLARAYLAAGQTGKGQTELKRFTRLTQTDPRVRRLRHHLALQPADQAARRRLAQLCVDTGRYREALQQYRLLTGAGTADAELFRGMARAAAAAGETRLAEQARASLRRLAPGD